MAIQILQDVALYGGIQFLDSLADFPANPSIGTMVLKGDAIYAYIKLGGMETWYPFANRTNSYVHTQGAANTTWSINHNLGTTDVWVQIKDNDGKIVNATVTVVDADNITITFTSAIIGTAVVVAPDSINVPEVKASLITVGNVVINSDAVLINGSPALTSANITAQIDNAVAVETTARTAADTTLQNNINAEATARASADTTLQSNIDAEVTVRQAADTNLQTQISNEVTARTSAVTTVTNNLNAEVTARTAADNALQTQIDGKVSSTLLGAANGVATLGADGKVPSGQLPSYVDDIVEYANQAAFPATGEASKIYVDQSTGSAYRWSGSVYFDISSASTADTAVKLATARTISLSGGVTGSTTFDGSTNVTIAATVANDSHTHSNYQPVDATLTALAGVSTAANKLIYATGADTFSTADLTAAGRALLDDADASTQRTTLGLGDSATKNTGTTAGTVAAGDHDHTGTYARTLPATVVSTGTTASAFNTYVLTVSCAVTLPASPAVNDIVQVVDISNSLTSTIARNGQNINGVADDLLLDVKNASITLQYVDATRGWVVI